MITDAIRGLSKEATIDGPTREVYLPEAQLVLPAYPKDIKGLRYSYSPAQKEGNFKAEIQVTTNETLQSAINNIYVSEKTEHIFEGVPKAQACGRQIVIVFEDIYGRSDHDNVKVGTAKLADGRTAFLYLDKACKENSEALIRYLQLIQSY